MSEDDKIYKALIMVQDDGVMAECVAIRHEGTFWLVPQWLDIPAEGMSAPERIIQLGGVSIQSGGKLGDREFDLLVNEPIPTAALYGPDPMKQQSRFSVVLKPNIRFRRLN